MVYACSVAASIVDADMLVLGLATVFACDDDDVDETGAVDAIAG
jgi:hypothetical protein